MPHRRTIIDILIAELNEVLYPLLHNFSTLIDYIIHLEELEVQSL